LDERHQGRRRLARRAKAALSLDLEGRRFAGNVRGLSPRTSVGGGRLLWSAGRRRCASPLALVRPAVRAASPPLTSGLLRWWSSDVSSLQDAGFFQRTGPHGCGSVSPTSRCDARAALARGGVDRPDRLCVLPPVA